MANQSVGGRLASTQPVPKARSRVRAWLMATLAGLILAAYLGISTIAAFTVTTPHRVAVGASPATTGLSYTDVRFAARGGDTTIAGWYLPHTTATRAIILVHGKDSSRSGAFNGHFVDLAAALHARGFATLLIDLRGHGDSGPGRFSFGLDERRDVIGAVDWLKAQGFTPGAIGVLGVSMGAASGIGATHDDADIGALVADCSYAEIYPLMQMHWGEASHLPDVFLPSTLLMGRILLGKDLTTANPVTEIGAIAPRPVLIIHGAADQFTPVAQGRELAAAAPAAQYWEVAGADHAESYLVNPQAYTTRVADFFDQALR